jgi:hypothetical protein
MFYDLVVDPGDLTPGVIVPWVFPHALIGGSSVVTGVVPNDIDYVVHEYEFDPEKEDILSKHGFRRLMKGDAEYDEIDNKRLIAVLERPEDADTKKINVIVVGAVFWAAHVAARVT